MVIGIFAWSCCLEKPHFGFNLRITTPVDDQGRDTEKRGVVQLKVTRIAHAFSVDQEINIVTAVIKQSQQGLQLTRVAVGDD